MTRDEVVALLARHQDAYTRRDVAALGANHAPEGTLDSPLGGKVRGRAAIEDIYRAWFNAFPDVTIENDVEPIIDGHRVAILSTLVGTDLGGFMEMPPTGKRFRMRLVRLYTLVDGHIAAEQRIYDFTGMLVQIGVLKAKPA
jgi:steroid delta-isomerase-like uncharacterized protein